MNIAHIKIVFRTLWKHKLFTGINILSLTLCLTGVISVLLLTSKLVTFDGFHVNNDRLYGLMEGDKDHQLAPGTTFSITEYLQADFPEIAKCTRMLRWDTYLLGHANSHWSVTPDFVDNDFLNMFTFPLRYGDVSTALVNVNSIVLSDELALRIFGDANPVGQQVLWADSLQLTVTGVLEPQLGASSLRFSALLPMQWLYSNSPYFKQMAQGNSRFVTSYVLLKEGADRAAFERKLIAGTSRYYQDLNKEPELGIIPFSEITPRYEPQLPYYVGGLRIVVFFLVLIAGVNLVNLTAASAFYRVREVGVRSVMGARSSHVITLFMMETATVVLFAMGIGIALVPPIIRYFNTEILTEFAVDFRWQQDYPVILQVVLIFIVLAFSAAWIPAQRLLRTPLNFSLKGQTSASPKQNMLQKGLVVLQFGLAVVFVFLTVVVQQQMNFMKRSNLGFDKQQVMVVDAFIGFQDREQAYQTLDHAISRLDQFPEVQSYTAGSNIPGHYRNWYNTISTNDKKVYCRVAQGVDSSYFSTYGISFLAGHNFHAPSSPIKQNTVILNQSAASALGWSPEEAIGQQVVTGEEGSSVHTVVGVTENFFYRALNSSIEPLAHFGSDHGGVSMLHGAQFISIRIDPSKVKPIADYLQDVFSGIPATGTFSYSFSNEVFERQYEREDMVLLLIRTAGGVAIFIACAGVFGLAAQLSRLRTKEIGIRKVLGAPLLQLVQLLSIRFIVLVAIAVIIAFPIGYLGASLWLNEFPYRIAVSWWMFCGTAIVVVFVAGITVSFQAIRAAMANPVKSLRDE